MSENDFTLSGKISANPNFAGTGNKDGQVVRRPFVRIVTLSTIAHSGVFKVIIKPALVKELTKRK